MSQIYVRDLRTIFIPAWGSNWGSSGFSHNQNTKVCQVHMSLHLLRTEHEDKTCVKCLMVHKDGGSIGFVFVFACMVGKKLKTPKLSPMADNAITQSYMGWYRRSGISGVYLW